MGTATGEAEWWKRASARPAVGSRQPNWLKIATNAVGEGAAASQLAAAARPPATTRLAMAVAPPAVALYTTSANSGSDCITVSLLLPSLQWQQCQQPHTVQNCAHRAKVVSASERFTGCRAI